MCHVECADQINTDDVLEIVQGQFPNGAIADDPGIVHQNVEPAALFLYLLHHRLDLLRMCDVTVDYERVDQCIRHFHRLGLVLALRVREIIHRALRSALPKSLDHFRANAARTTGDEHNFAGEIQ